MSKYNNNDINKEVLAKNETKIYRTIKSSK